VTFNGVVIGALLVACSSGGHGMQTGDDVEPTPDAPDAPMTWSAEPACAATAEAIYTTPPMLPPARGMIVSCALGDKLDQATVQSEMVDDGAEGVTAQTGANIVKVAYRTVRSDGSVAVTTATVYLPLVPRTLPAPVVLIGRPTSGIADSCAPSKKPRPERNLALPFAARGYVTITPDFAGLGNEGTHAYLDNHEAVAELFDGALALRQLVPLVGDPIAAVGYSQGGGVVLSTQALELATTGKHTLKAVAALAPQWPISTKSFGYEDVLRNPDRITGLAGLAPPTVTVLRHYGFAMNKLGDTHGGDAFPAEERSSIIGSIESLCTVPLGGALGANQLRLKELVDETFRTSMLACIDGTAGCTGLAQQFHTWITGDFVTADPQGARVLIVQGLADQVMPAAGEAACDVAKLRNEGVAPDICSDTTATHDTVLERRIEDVVAWVEAVVSGVAPPSCSSQTLPACNR
jgi:intracellular sulfur oxidation DsrE/DsrF family protein